MNNQVQRVCICPGTLSRGGIGQNALNLAEELLERGVFVDLFLTSINDERVKNIPIGVNLITGGGRTLNSLFHFVKYLKSCSPDMIISAHEHINILAIVGRAISQGNSKVICTFRTYRSYDIKGKSFKEKIYQQIASKLYKYADELVAVSKGVAEDLENILNLNPGTVHVIYNPAWNNSLANQRSQLANHPWLQNKDHFVILSVGRLAKQKDYPTLLRAFAFLRSNIDARLIIIGEGEEREKLESITKQLKIDEYVDLHGFVDNPISYMTHADVFVLSSAWEGFGNVIVEALGSGIPVVSTNCPSGPAEILSWGKYGELVEVGNYIELGKSIIKVSSRADKLSSDYLIRRAEEFSSKNSADQYLLLGK